MAVDSLLRSTSARLAVIDHYLNLCEAFEKSSDIGPIDSSFRSYLTLNSLRSLDQTEEKVFRHCAVITRLYSLFENFAESAASYWLSRLPSYRTFPDCEESFRNTYRCGIAQLIQNIEKKRYQHLDIKVVTERYFGAIRGIRQWEIVPEAIVSRESNLRKSELEAILSSCGIKNSWSFIENHPDVKPLTTGGTGMTVTLEESLNEMVTLRNDASHGSPDEILGIDILRGWVKFVQGLCNALRDLIWSKIVTEEMKRNPSCIKGVVTETLSGGICVAVCGRGLLRKGDRLFLYRSTTGSCLAVDLVSLQLDGANKEKIVVASEGTEVGLKTARKAHIGTLLIKIPEYC